MLKNRALEREEIENLGAKTIRLFDKIRRRRGLSVGEGRFLVSGRWVCRKETRSKKGCFWAKDGLKTGVSQAKIFTKSRLGIITVFVSVDYKTGHNLRI